MYSIKGFFSYLYSFKKQKIKKPVFYSFIIIIIIKDYIYDYDYYVHIFIFSNKKIKYKSYFYNNNYHIVKTEHTNK